MNTREHSFLLQIGLLIAAAATFFLLKRWSTRRLRAVALWPPGPLAWPVVGHLHLLGDLPHQSLCRLSKTYGPLMGLRLGSIPTIVASSPETAREILQINDLAFANRPRLAAPAHLGFGDNDMVFVPYGPVMRRMRQLCAAELFSTKRLESFRSVREGEARELARQVVELGEDKRQAVEVRRGLMTVSNNIICRMTMGKRLEEVTEQGGRVDVVKLMEEVLELITVVTVGDFIPWLRWLDPQEHVRRLVVVGEQARHVFQEIIRQRRQEPPRPSPEEDLLDVLLAATAEPSTDVSLTDENVMGIMMNFFVGGAQTSALAVEWALADLVNSPAKLHKLQEELDGVVGRNRLVAEDDIQSLPYLTWVLKESMRLHPATPLLVPREATEECRVGAYTIPRGARAFVNTWAIGRDPSLWERPLEFLPERFEGSNGDLRSKDFDLLPFGSGRRACPGWASGSLTVHILLATLVHAFDWLPGAGSLVDMSEKLGLTLTLAKPLRVFASPRLPAHAY